MLAQAQSMSIQRGHGVGGYTDGAALITQTPQAITADQSLEMSGLVSSLYTNKTKLKSSMRIRVAHRDKIAQRPAVRVAKYTPALIKELHKLRDSYLRMMNQVAYENADVKIEGMPTVTSRYGHRRGNVFKKSERDKEGVARRAEQSALLQLQRLIRSKFKIGSYGISNHITHHYRIPDGEYLLCVIQRVKNTESKSVMGSKTAIWWTKFLIEKDKPKALYLDETNAISWDEIFTVRQ